MPLIFCNMRMKQVSMYKMQPCSVASIGSRKYCHSWKVKTVVIIRRDHKRRRPMHFTSWHVPDALIQGNYAPHSIRSVEQNSDEVTHWPPFIGKAAIHRILSPNR